MGLKEEKSPYLAPPSRDFFTCLKSNWVCDDLCRISPILLKSLYENSAALKANANKSIPFLAPKKVKETNSAIM